MVCVETERGTVGATTSFESLPRVWVGWVLVQGDHLLRIASTDLGRVSLGPQHTVHDSV